MPAAAETEEPASAREGAEIMGFGRIWGVRIAKIRIHGDMPWISVLLSSWTGSGAGRYATDLPAGDTPID